jgi:1-acyl-sn-glycerol-3-phosphate acyltransferase
MTGLRLGGILRLSALALATVTLLPVQLVVVRLMPGRSAAIPLLFHRITCRCLGVRRRIRGTPPPPGSGGLIVANHVSWLDISVIGAQQPLCFVAKSEVRGWPVIGFLSRLQHTVFIDR